MRKTVSLFRCTLVRIGLIWKISNFALTKWLLVMKRKQENIMKYLTYEKKYLENDFWKYNNIHNLSYWIFWKLNDLFSLHEVKKKHENRDIDYVIYWQIKLMTKNIAESHSIYIYQYYISFKNNYCDKA